MKIRSKAPLRLGIAGGGTDVSPYSDIYGGCVLNATINMYAHTYLDDEVEGNKLYLEAMDLGVVEVIDLDQPFNISGKLILHKAVYLKLMNDYNDGRMVPLKITTHSDAPPGSGLGSSSTMVVSILEALRNYLSIPLGEYEIALLAYNIERNDCQLSGGKQDQYAATFGGFNFMEFKADNHVVINPLRIRRYIINELEASLILYFTGASRDSARIIDEQMKSIASDQHLRLEGMHQVKASAYKIKEHLFKVDINKMASEFHTAWLAKKSTSSSISNKMIDDIEEKVFAAGAKSMKVSGAGGGGFIMIFIEPEKRLTLEHELANFDGHIQKFQFTDEGAYSWNI